MIVKACYNGPAYAQSLSFSDLKQVKLGTDPKFSLASRPLYMTVPLPEMPCQL
jgi:hypothetical protein